MLAAGRYVFMVRMVGIIAADLVSVIKKLLDDDLKALPFLRTQNNGK